jgi:hypothetical protein
MKTTKNAAAGTAKAKVQEAGRQLVDQASTAAEAGKQEAVNFLEEQKDEAANKVRDLDHALRLTAEKVDNPGMGRMIESLAGEVDRLANTLETTEYADMLRAAERLSRQNTTLFMAGSFAIGLAAARFIRSSARHADPIPASIY